MAEVTIKKERRFNYDNFYEVNLKTTKKLTKEEFASIISAIKIIEDVFDAHIDDLFAKEKANSKV